MKRFKDYSIKKTMIISIMSIICSSLLISTLIYFFILYNALDNTVEDNSKEINKQIIMNFENYIDDVRNIGVFLQYETLENDISDNTKIHSVYQKYSTFQDEIVSINLLDLNGKIVASSEVDYISNYYLYEKSWFIDAFEDESMYAFSSPHIQDVFVNRTENVISLSKVISYYDNDIKKDGLLLIDLNIDKIDNLASKTNLGDSGHLIILNDDNSLVYSSSDQCRSNTCESALIAKSIIIGGDYVPIDEHDMYVNINTIDGTRWRIATFINVDEIAEAKLFVNVVFGISFIITFLISLFVANRIALRISKPLIKLQKHMDYIQNEDNLYTTVNVEGQKEIIILSKTFNRMIFKIRELMFTLLQEQKDKRKTELIALQTQINPHFLYNTLDSIIWLAENDRNEDVIKMVVSLSRFFRISISNGKSIIPISEEVEHAKNYMLIQKIRYSNKYEYKFEISEDIKDIKVVKLILQPLIENAIYHGISSTGDGFITVRVFKDNQNIIFEVENNGYGISENKISQIYTNINSNVDQKSIGLRNVYQRLRLYYGNNADFKIISLKDDGTIVRLTIPLEKGGK